MGEVSTQAVLDSIKEIPRERLDEVVDFIEFLKWKARKQEIEFDEWAMNLAKEKGFALLTEDEIAEIVHLHRKEPS